MSGEELPGLPVASERGSRRVWWIVAGVVLAILALRFAPRVGNPLAPEPRAAHVAIQPAGEEVASESTWHLEAGRPFRLYAVLEAETWSGEKIYYTEAPALRLGSEEVPSGALRPWPAGRPARVRWQTVEPFGPYLAVADGADLERFRLVESNHPEWGTAWSAEGEVDPRIVKLERGSDLRPLPFGTQRFVARIELYASEDALIPTERWESPGPEQMLASPGLGSGVVASLPPPLSRLSEAAGRIRLDPRGDLDEPSNARIGELVRGGFAFLAPALLAAHLRENGVDPETLEFETVELGPQGPRWGEGAAAGDLLGAGDRMLVLWRDRGEPGRLDRDDLAFDLDRGLRIERIGEVFRGEESLRLDLARVAPRAAAPARP